MRRLLAVITAASARPENATEYFDVASRLWPPTSTAGRCLAQQHKYGWRPKPHGSNFKTLGTEGVGHHLCGNQISDAPPSTRRVFPYVTALISAQVTTGSKVCRGASAAAAAS